MLRLHDIEGVHKYLRACWCAGAQNDLERVTKMAYAQVAVYGMNEKVRQPGALALVLSSHKRVVPCGGRLQHALAWSCARCAVPGSDLTATCTLHSASRCGKLRCIVLCFIRI